MKRSNKPIFSLKELHVPRVPQTYRIGIFRKTIFPKGSGISQPLLKFGPNIVFIRYCVFAKNHNSFCEIGFPVNLQRQNTEIISQADYSV